MTVYIDKRYFNETFFKRDLFSTLLQEDLFSNQVNIFMFSIQCLLHRCYAMSHLVVYWRWQMSQWAIVAMDCVAVDCGRDVFWRRSFILVLQNNFSHSLESLPYARWYLAGAFVEKYFQGFLILASVLFVLYHEALVVERLRRLPRMQEVLVRIPPRAKFGFHNLLYLIEWNVKNRFVKLI